MKKLFAVLALCALVLVGCGSTKSENTTPTDSSKAVPQIVTPTGEGEAAVPEDGDISIEIG